MSSMLSQLSVVPLGPKSLVIHQETAKWVMVYPELATLFDRDEPAVCERLTSVFTAAGLGEAADDSRRLGLLILKLTSACNYRCSYCYDAEALNHSGTMPYA